MINKLCILLGAGALVALSPAANAQIVSGPAVVVDGDSLELTGTHIRLSGIDAPENRQTCQRDGEDWPCGEDAANRLRILVKDQEVRCEGRDLDRGGHLIATCSVNSLDLGLMMVQSGLATVQDNADPTYHDAFARASKAGLGIWGTVFQDPADWRAAHPHEEPRPKRLASPPGQQRPRTSPVYKNAFGCAIKGNRSPKGEWIYHLPGMRYYEDTRPEELFCTESEAIAAGYRRARAN